MSDSEHDIQSRILRLATGGVRLFRLNAGRSWQGRASSRPGGVWLEGGRPIAGLPTGTPDIGGCVSVVVTPDMVGVRVAVAVLIEVKKLNGRLSDAQIAALAAAESLGVRCGVARSVDDAVGILGCTGIRAGNIIGSGGNS